MVSFQNTEEGLLLENEHIRLMLRWVEGRLTQEYYIKDGGGLRRVLISDRDSMDLTRFPFPRDIYLKAENTGIEIYNELLEVDEGDEGYKVVRVGGESPPHKVETEFILRGGDKYITVNLHYLVDGESRVEWLLCPYLFLHHDGPLNDSPGECWVPNMRPGDDFVIGDHCFRSPAILLRKEGDLAALIPDLGQPLSIQGVRACLDLDVKGGMIPTPYLSYGIMGYKRHGHLYYRHSPGMTFHLKDTSIKFGYFLYLDHDVPDGEGKGIVTRFLWKRFGEGLLREIDPQVVRFEDYARRTYHCIFEQHKAFREFEIEERRCMGTFALTYTSSNTLPMMNRLEIKTMLRSQPFVRLIHNAAIRYLESSSRATDLMERLLHRVKLRIVPQVLFQSWFNNLRTSYGLYWFGRKWGDERLMEWARMMKNLVLCAPRENGVFSTVCFCPREGVFWHKGTRGFEYLDYYSTACTSTTATWILRWYRDLEEDEDIIPFLKEYADFLCGVQTPSGAIPSWMRFGKGGIEIDNRLKESANSSSSLRFLIEYYRFTGEKKYLDAAQRGAEFLIKSVLPEGKWWDFETFFSCSRKPLDFKDPHTGIPPQNTLCMYWSSELFLRLYETLGVTDYLKYGVKILNLLCLYQQVWNNPSISINTFGGFGVMNTDGEWNDARSALFAVTLMDYYTATGMDEYFLRGVAALRSSFVLMLMPENLKQAPGNLGRYRDRDNGVVFENYGHMGYDRRVPGYVEFDWGSGSASTAAAVIERRYGDVFLDLNREKAFGINGCSIGSFKVADGNIHMGFSSLLAPPRPLIIKATGGNLRRYRIFIDGVDKGGFTLKELKKGVYVSMP